MTHGQVLDNHALTSRWITTVGAICDKTGGEVQTGPFGSQLHASDYVRDGIPVVMPQDLQNGRISCDRIARVPETYQRTLGRHVLRSGDIIFSRRGDVTRFAVVTDAEAGWICGTGCVRIRLNAPDIIVGYVRRYLQQEVVGNWLKHHAKGVTMPNLNTSVVRALPFVYPPLPEQRRIAEVLDRAEALRAKRRNGITQLEGMTSAMFMEMFGDPGSNPKGWPEHSIADLCEVKGGKRLPKGEEYSTEPTLFRYIRVTDLKKGSVDESALVYIPPEVQARIARYVVHTGDIIISIAGSIGLVAPVPSSLDGVNLTENAAKLVPREQGVYEPTFLATVLQTPEVQRRIGAQVGQVTIGKLALFRIEKLRVPLPPLELQREFARRLASLERLKVAQRDSRAEIDALFASLQHRAFRGEL